MGAGFARSKHNVLGAFVDDPFGDRATDTAKTAAYQICSILFVQGDRRRACDDL
jgi:hypothetical protein